jgi:hypothetical protein
MTYTHDIVYPTGPTASWPGGWAVVRPDGSTLAPHKTEEDARYYSKGRPVKWVPTAWSPKGGPVALDIDYYDHTRWHFKAHTVTDHLTGEMSILVHEIDERGQIFGNPVERVGLPYRGAYLSSALRAYGWFVVGKWESVNGQLGWFVAGESAAKDAVATVCRGNAYNIGPDEEEQATAIARVLEEQRPQKTGPGPGGNVEPKHPPLEITSRSNGSGGSHRASSNGSNGSNGSHRA